MKSARVLLFLGIAVVLAGLLARNGTVIALSFAPLAYFGVALARRPEALDLSVVRDVTPASVDIGEEAMVSMTITNNGARIERVVVEDLLPRGLTTRDDLNTAQFDLESNSSYTLQYLVSGPRGSYAFAKVRIAATETFGLFGDSVILRSAALPLVVQPASEMIGTNRIQPERTRGFAGPLPVRVAGAGVNFLSLREYQPGDRLRAINWRVTERISARAPDLASAIYTNVFEQQRIADIGFIVDARVNADVRAGEETLFEYSVRAARSLTQSFLDDGHRVSLLVYGAGVDHVSIGSGRRQQQRITSALSAARTGEHLIFNSLANIPTRFFGPGSQLIFIGPVHAFDVAALSGLRGRGFAVLVVSPSPITAGIASQLVNIENPYGAATVDLAAVERSIQFNHLRREGIVVVDWDLQAPLQEVVRRAANATRGQRTVRSA